MKLYSLKIEKTFAVNEKRANNFSTQQKEKTEGQKKRFVVIILLTFMIINNF